MRNSHNSNDITGCNNRSSKNRNSSNRTAAATAATIVNSNNGNKINNSTSNINWKDIRKTEKTATTDKALAATVTIILKSLQRTRFRV